MMWIQWNNIFTWLKNRHWKHLVDMSHLVSIFSKSVTCPEMKGRSTSVQLCYKVLFLSALRKWIVFFGSEQLPCSQDGHRPVVLPLLACKREMTSHLVSPGISSKHGRGKTEASKIQLILNHTCLCTMKYDEQLQAMTICPQHRKDLTTDWPGHKGQICSYPAHEGLKKRINHPQWVNAGMSAEIFAAFNLGSLLAQVCSFSLFVSHFSMNSWCQCVQLIHFLQVRELITLQHYFGTIFVI